MRYRRLGRTDLQVSTISLGGLFLGKLADGRNTANTVRRANELGINLIDTAPAYQGSEEAIGKALAGGLRKRFLISTKWWPYAQDGKEILQDPEALRLSVEKSLRNLRTDWIDLFLFHSLSYRKDVETLVKGPLMEEIGRLKKEGKIQHVGASNSGELDPADEILREGIQAKFFDVVMPEFLIFRQGPIRNLFPYCVVNSTGVIGITPLGQAASGYGLRDKKYLLDSMAKLIARKSLPDREIYRKDDVLDFLLDEKTPDLPAAALRFCLSFPEVSTVLCGTNDAVHLAQNAAVSDAGAYDPQRLDQVMDLFGGI